VKSFIEMVDDLKTNGENAGGHLAFWELILDFVVVKKHLGDIGGSPHEELKVYLSGLVL
jgi:hypothetical protein